MVHFKVKMENVIAQSSCSALEPQPLSDALVRTDAESEIGRETSRYAIAGQSYLPNMWYFAVAGSKLKRSQTIQKKIMGDLIMVGRDGEGQVFAMKDICPHQGVPLTQGRFDGKEIQCCFHGWRFDTQGQCTAIPALCSDQEFNLCSVRTRSYPCREVQGTVWIYIGKPLQPMPEIPRAEGLDGIAFAQTTTTLFLENHIDYNTLALIDTAHVPYVHNAWWWRSANKPKDKQKTYVPTGTGWTMVKHKPSKHSIVFNLIGDKIETEIGFRLPGCRIEHIVMNGRTMLSGITALTPIDETHTELHHTTYWTVLPLFAPLVTPFVQYFVRAFLKQDADIAAKQKIGLATNTPLILTIKDSGTPGRWYFDLKKAWGEATEQGRAFVNPIKETILRWRT